MTRINLVPPEELHRKHLIAEYHELPRIFSYVRIQLAKGVDPATIKAPSEYTLGTGHMKFFYTRLGFLLERQAELIIEMTRRKIKVRFDDLKGLAEGIPEHLFGNYEPTPEALALNRQRLAERLAEMEARPKRPVPSHKD
jgi:deoxyribonuclease (pyrimidine dimer)